jgi:hypothetical protein
MRRSIVVTTLAVVMERGAVAMPSFLTSCGLLSRPVHGEGNLVMRQLVWYDSGIETIFMRCES